MLIITGAVNAKIQDTAIEQEDPDSAAKTTFYSVPPLGWRSSTTMTHPTYRLNFCGSWGPNQ